MKTRYKAFVFLYPCTTPLLRTCIDQVKASGVRYLVIDADNANATPQALRDFFARSGVTVRCDKCAVIYENESYLFLHTTSDEEITLCYEGRLREVFGNNVSFPASLPKGKSLLFEKMT